MLKLKHLQFIVAQLGFVFVFGMIFFQLYIFVGGHEGGK